MILKLAFCPWRWVVDISWEQLSLILRAFNELAPGFGDPEGMVGGVLLVAAMASLAVYRLLSRGLCPQTLSRKDGEGGRHSALSRGVQRGICTRRFSPRPPWQHMR